MFLDPTIFYYASMQCAEIRCVEEPMAERQITWMQSLAHIEYWLGCMGNNCWRPKYDCMWLIIASLLHVGVDINRGQYLYGETFAKENEIWLYSWVRWDYLFMDNMHWEINHIAIITQQYDGTWYWILDSYNNKTKASQRFIYMRWGWYAWQYKIIIARLKK